MQPPPLLLLSRLFSSFCYLSVQILPSECIHCTQSAQCVFVLLLEKRRACVCACVCVRDRERIHHNLTTASWGHHSHVCVSVCLCFSHRVESQLYTTTLDSASSASVARKNADKNGRSCPWPSLHIWTMLYLLLYLSDPLVGSTSTLSMCFFLLITFNKNKYLHMNSS